MVTEDKLDCYSFARELLRTGDLDPVYILLWEAGFPRDLLSRWLLAYWCFYDVGTASVIAARYRANTVNPDAGYWEKMAEAAGSKAFPRGHERRHFRGAAAAKSVGWLRKQGVEALFGPFYHYPNATTPYPPPASAVMGYVKTWAGFGPWIAFKVADMLERLDLCPVDFGGGADIFLFDSPREGAARLWAYENGDILLPEGGVGGWAVGRILREVGAPLSTPLESRRTADLPRKGRIPLRRGDRVSRGFLGVLNGVSTSPSLFRTSSDGTPLAPPRYDRPLGPQEAETALCKWKAYLGGHYVVGEDVKACRKALARTARCPLSQGLFRAGKRGVIW